MGVKIIVLVLTFGMALLLAFEKIIKNEKKATAFEYVIFFILLAASALNLWQIMDDNDQNKIKEATESANRDSLRVGIQRGIDSGISNNYKLLAFAFAKQKIDFDSLKFSIGETKQIVSRINEVTPDLDFSAENGIKFINEEGGYNNFRISFTCRDAKATDIDINLYSVILWSNGKYERIPQKYLFMDGNLDLSKDSEYSSIIGLSTNPFHKINCIFIVAKGIYWNASHTKSYSLYSVRRFEMKSKVYSDLPPETYPSVRKLLEPK